MEALYFYVLLKLLKMKFDTLFINDLKQFKIIKLYKTNLKIKYIFSFFKFKNCLYLIFKIINKKLNEKL